MIAEIARWILREEIQALKRATEDRNALLKISNSLNSEFYQELENQREIIKKMKTETSIRLIREYHPTGTNGQLYVNDQLICFTIELPWKNNERRVSCIPEGRYLLSKRTSPRFGNHIYVANVPGRSGILFHPANNAATELQGCISPVSTLVGHGRGNQSKKAMDILNSVVYGAIDSKKVVAVYIESANGYPD